MVVDWVLAPDNVTRSAVLSVDTQGWASSGSQQLANRARVAYQFPDSGHMRRPTSGPAFVSC